MWLSGWIWLDEDQYVLSLLKLLVAYICADIPNLKKVPLLWPKHPRHKFCFMLLKISIAQLCNKYVIQNKLHHVDHIRCHQQWLLKPLQCNLSSTVKMHVNQHCFWVVRLGALELWEYPFPNTNHSVCLIPMSPLLSATTPSLSSG